MTKALVIGGTGPSGPWLVHGLLERGIDVSVLHRGAHEAQGPDVAFMESVPHIHADPHFKQEIAAALDGLHFDFIIATYGRIKGVAEACVGKCDSFLGVGGIPAYQSQFDADQTVPYGMRLLAGEESPLADDTSGGAREPSTPPRKIVETERTIRALHDAGKLSVTWFRYPSVYGPRNPRPHEWYVLRRARDGRRVIIVPDGGLTVRTRISGRNAAHAVLCAVDRPQSAAGRVYNIGDDLQFTVRQWAETLALICGMPDVQVVSLPWELARPAWGLFPRGDAHALVDTTRIRRELGYRDAVTPQEALAESVAWYTQNPVSDDDAAKYGFYFDYEAEDEVIREYSQAIARIDRDSRIPTTDQGHHIYAHPAQAGARDAQGR